MRRSSRIQLEPDSGRIAIGGGVGHHAARWALLLVLAILTYVLYPVARGIDVPVLDEGAIPQSEVLAPFEFEVPKTASEISREAGALAASVPAVVIFHDDSVSAVARDADSLFAVLQATDGDSAGAAAAQALGVRLTPEEAGYLRERTRLARFRRITVGYLDRALRQGVPLPGSLQGEPGPELMIQRNQREQLLRRDSVLTFESFLARRFAEHPDTSSAGDQVYVKLLTGLFRPSLTLDVRETERRRDELRATVDSVKYVVRAQERIVDRGEPVTPEARDRLLALRSELIRRAGAQQDVPGVLSQVLTNALVLSVFWLLLMLYRPATYDDLRQLGVLAAVFAVVIVGSWLNRLYLQGRPELIPIPFAAMLATVLISGRVALIAAMVMAVLVGSQVVYGGTDAVFVALVGGTAGAMGVRTVRRRNHLLLAAVVVSAAFLVAAVTVGLRQGWPVADIAKSSFWGAVNAFFSAGLALMVLPVFERAARVTTDLTLLELSDPSHPLLKRLATEAPGTYAHSIAMANLCEAACDAIGANGLLARVGCYYHDVGKVKKPQYFVENQVPGVNPHDKLKPDVSAGIIRNHVRDGLQLAEEHGLPEALKAFIPQHHGTMEISYFLDRARKRNPDADLPVEQFRYPGPRPRSVETAIVMLADGVEAALRVLAEPTEQRVADAVEHIVMQRVNAGQLEEAPLTLAQLTSVKREFQRVLSGAYHNRIDYPAASGGISATWDATSET